MTLRVRVRVRAVCLSTAKYVTPVSAFTAKCVRARVCRDTVAMVWVFICVYFVS